MGVGSRFLLGEFQLSPCFVYDAVVSAFRVAALEEGAEESNRPGEKWQYYIQQRDKWLLITTEDNNVTAVEEIHEG